jgi:rhodanese-related sulfurtransferase
MIIINPIDLASQRRVSDLGFRKGKKMKANLTTALFIMLMAITVAFFPYIGMAQDKSFQIKTAAKILSEASKSVRQINPVALNAMMDQKDALILLDVRTERERDAGYIGGSVWIPRGAIEFKFPEVCQDPEKKIIVYCRKGGRSALAACTLQQMGYRNVLNLEGGINAWGASGFSLYNWHGEIKVSGFDKKETHPSTYDIFNK